MSLPTYLEYKNSGNAWLGQVPSHWESWRISHAFSCVGSGTTPPSDDAAWYSDGTIPWVTTGELRESVVYETTKSVTASAMEKFSALKLHPAGSLAIAMYGATIGRLGILGVDATTNQACCVLSRPRNLDVRFVFHWLQGFKQILIDLYATGGGQPNINQEMIASLRIPAPNLIEQNAITTFLDRETAKIDGLIAEQKKLITLLAEKRQATISHAVTKGLNPDALMKDSGVAWLGEVPAHWNVRPLKYLVSFSSGGTPSKDNLDYWDGDVPWASAKDLKVEILFDTADHITHYAVDTGATLLPAETVLVVVRGMILARTFPVTQIAVPMAINQDLKGLLPKSEIHSSFLSWLLRGSADETLQRLDEAGHGTKALRMDAWSSMQLPLPPKHEQIAIAEFIAQETSRLDTLTAEATLGIALLNERRFALISAAVTGKIDVRQS